MSEIADIADESTRIVHLQFEWSEDYANIKISKHPIPVTSDYEGTDVIGDAWVYQDKNWNTIDVEVFMVQNDFSFEVALGEKYVLVPVVKNKEVVRFVPQKIPATSCMLHVCCVVDFKGAQFADTAE